MLGAHPPSKCPDIQEASFKCKTADYDEAAGTGFERTFTPAVCPSQADTAMTPVYNDSYPPSTCTSIQEENFKCRTGDYDATTSPVTGYTETFNIATCPTTGSGTATGDVHSWFPVSSCRSLAETDVKCRRASGCGFDVAGTMEYNPNAGPDFFVRRFRDLIDLIYVVRGMRQNFFVSNFPLSQRIWSMLRC